MMSAKILFLLRHAEAASDHGSGDHERMLTDRGERDAVQLGRIMKDRNYHPAYSLCSTARRTQQTLTYLADPLIIPAVEFDKSIYHASREDLLAIAQGFQDQHSSALIVGHNPAIHELAALLAVDDGSDLYGMLIRSYAPGTLSVLSCPAASWMDLRPGKNTLLDMIAPT